MTWARLFNRTLRGRLFGAAFRIGGRPIFRKYARRVIDNLETLERQRRAPRTGPTGRPSGG
jgi:hypothetical protein